MAVTFDRSTLDGRVWKRHLADQLRLLWVGHVENEQPIMYRSQKRVVAFKLDIGCHGIDFIPGKLSRIARIGDVHHDQPFCGEKGIGSGKRKGIYAPVHIIAAQASRIQWIRHVKDNQVGSTRGVCQILALNHRR